MLEAGKIKTAATAAKYALVVAPYCPPDRPGIVALGAASKIEAVIQGLVLNGFKVILLNSGHQSPNASPRQVADSNSRGTYFTEIHPRAYCNRRLGKLLQAIWCPWDMARLVRHHHFGLIWIYNPYLYESLAMLSFRLMAAPALRVLQLEDHPSARRRSWLDLKNRIDGFCFKLVSPRVDVVSLVNPSLREGLAASKARVEFLPVLLPAGMPTAPRTPDYRQLPVVGYFGTLNEEKGVAELLRIWERLDLPVTLIVVGRGELEALVSAAAQRDPRIRFHRALPAEDFDRVYATVDVVVNLHKPIFQFGGGIFPYKLLEAVAHRKTVVSTRMDGCPVEVADAITWTSRSDADMVAFLEGWGQRSEADFQKICRAASWINDHYSAQAGVRRILQGDVRHI